MRNVQRLLEFYVQVLCAGRLCVHVFYMCVFIIYKLVSLLWIMVMVIMDHAISTFTQSPTSACYLHNKTCS